ncbi:hypothetical protein AA313_de0203148 [Arthrobotrys entomopaga]|nr:hypothetical protein AA313_de0203148 [Arthrobotrys entomopaga]
MYKYQAYEREYHQRGRDIPPDVLADMFHSVTSQHSKNHTRQRAPPPEYNTRQYRRPVAYDAGHPPVPQEKPRIPQTYRFPPEPAKQFVRFVVPSVEHTVEYRQTPRGKHPSQYQRAPPPPPPPPRKPQRLRARYVEPVKEPEPPLLQFHISRWDRFVHRIREFIEGE